MKLSFFWSKSFLLNRHFLWLLFVVNLLGTVYGYIWYEHQLRWTFDNKPLWMLPFVPDSPTSSLFFTIALLYLLFPPHKPSPLASAGRIIIEGLAVVCSVKYGIWAVAMIAGGWWQGDVLNWTHYMLIVSHLAMAFEALLYLRFMKVGLGGLVLGTGWLLLNDTVDYTFEIYPYLPTELHDYVDNIKLFTFGLSIASFVAALLAWRFRKQE